MTSKWKVGSDLVAASNQPFFPNDVSREAEEDGNPLPSLLGGYARVDLNTSYDVTDHVQVYGLVKNLVQFERTVSMARTSKSTM